MIAGLVPHRLTFVAEVPGIRDSRKLTDDKISLEVKRKRSIVMLAMSVLLTATAALYAQNLEQHIQGEWEMDLRLLRFPGVVYYQENGSVFINEQQPDGTFRILSRITTRAVADEKGLLIRPGCEDKTECIYDDASEGVGRLINGKLYIDWISEGWIDDVFTISGDTMTGDDGNGPIKLTKKR